ARRCLLFEELAQIAVTRFQLAEQTCILDRDHRLIGERRKQADLFLRKRSDLMAPQRDDAEQPIASEEWDGENSANVLGSMRGLDDNSLLGLKVEDLDGFSRERGAPAARRAVEFEPFPEIGRERFRARGVRGKPKS